MRNFCVGSGKVIVMQLQKGELVLETIIEQLERLEVKNAVLISGVGSFRKLNIHYTIQNTDVPVDKQITLDEAVEIGCMQGIVLDGEPHIHLTCTHGNSVESYTGHLHEGNEVLYLLELAFLILDDEPALTRKKDSLGISYIDLK